MVLGKELGSLSLRPYTSKMLNVYIKQLNNFDKDVEKIYENYLDYLQLNLKN